ncbi:hypothetical protein O9H85_12440 [Paenibacillus filicis]|uniref:Citrate transporter-like domain-containing protein n=1 Tax=Paenibacillus gyeongsangnamensis TaxID=3388067 RepID=A0ABT4Q943_9BACL|nr:hypothetical protein [Paenibacillus filicis]MCZ8513220.1 hypothetical protein [Paenibacillus filicis]
MTHKLISTSRPYLYTLLVAAFVLYTLTGWRVLLASEGTIAILCLMVSLSSARRMFQIAGILFIAAGIACVIWGDVPLLDLPYLFTSNVMLISLLYMLPFVNHIIRIGGYDRNLSRWLNVESGHMGQLYVRSLIVSYLLSLFLFFAALPLLHRVLGKHFQGKDPMLANRFKSMSILRGFGTVAVWSPVEPLVATAVVITGISYTSLFPWLFGLSLLLLAVGSAWGWGFRSIAMEPAGENHAGPPSWSKTGVFLLALMLLILSAYGLQRVLSCSFFTAMMFVLLPFSAVWALLLGQFNRFVLVSRKQWRVSTDGLRHLLVLFLSFGFFNSAVAKTSLFQMLEGPVLWIAHTPLLLFCFIFAVFLILPVLGIHPLVVMSLFGILLQPVLGTLNPVSLAIVLITCALNSSFMGTFNSTVTILSGLLHMNPYRITRWNLGFAFIFGGIGIAVGLWLL